MKLNIGSHNKRIEGYLNVDVLDLENVDIVWDITKIHWDFSDFLPKNKFGIKVGVVMDNSVEEIIMTEVLEHIGWRDTEKVLKEAYRVLEAGGKLHIQVPDIREMMFNYWNGQICDCVPHKPKNKEESMAKLDCPKCNGYGRVNPVRWKMAFLGSQKHPYDTHKNIFTPESLREELEKAGFDKIEIGSDEYGWKIKANAYKL